MAASSFLIQVLDAVRNIKIQGKRDPEGAHAAEDKLYERVLREIANGHLTKAEAVAYATEALKTKEAKFARWTA